MKVKKTKKNLGEVSRKNEVDPVEPPEDLFGCFNEEIRNSLKKLEKHHRKIQKCDINDSSHVNKDVKDVKIPTKSKIIRPIIVNSAPSQPQVKIEPLKVRDAKAKTSAVKGQADEIQPYVESVHCYFNRSSRKRSKKPEPAPNINISLKKPSRKLSRKPKPSAKEVFKRDIEKHKKLIVLLEPLDKIKRTTSTVHVNESSIIFKDEIGSLVDSPIDPEPELSDFFNDFFDNDPQPLSPSTSPSPKKKKRKKCPKKAKTDNCNSNKKRKLDEKMCDLCGQYFLNLGNHIKAMHEGRAPQRLASKILQYKKPPTSIFCSFCSQHFDDEKSSLFFDHMKKHDPGWHSNCPFCDKVFFIFSDYTKHVQIFHPYQCPVEDCTEKERAFNFLTLFKQHMRSKHRDQCQEFGVKGKGRELNFLCGTCGASFSQQSFLDDHIIVHEDPASVTCTICQKIFKKKRIFDEHMKNSHGEKNIPCPFEGCKRFFASQDTLRQHRYYHDPNSIKNIYRSHKRQEDTYSSRKRISSTSFDGAKFPQNPQNKCPKCYKTFDNISTYHNHIGVFHNDDKIELKSSSAGKEIFNCPIEFCPAKSESRRVLNIHIKYDHAKYAKDFVKNAEKKFKCRFCDRSYNYQHALKDHELCHTDPSQTTCDICSKFFTSSLQKRSHVREIHSEKDISCTFPNCSKKFALLVNLKKHLKSAHGTSPYID